MCILPVFNACRISAIVYPQEGQVLTMVVIP